MALGSPVPWYGSGAATYIHRRSPESPSPDGFILAQKRLGRPEAEICYAAPTLASGPAVEDTWQRLLEHLIAQAGDNGIQRLYACVPSADDAAALLSRCGFASYVRETLFRLRALPDSLTTAPADPFVRSQREADSFAIQRLVDHHTPQVVLKAEGAFYRDGASSHALIFQNWWQPGQADGLVYEREGEVLGAVIMHKGAGGVWLRLLGDPGNKDVVEALLAHALKTLPEDKQPVYCSVRSYQSAISASLFGFGFDEVTELARFVKYTTVHAQEPVAKKNRLLVETTFPGVISSHIHESSLSENHKP